MTASSFWLDHASLSGPPFSSYPATAGFLNPMVVVIVFA